MNQKQTTMRKNEEYVLNLFRKDPLASTFLFTVPLFNALNRLKEAGMLRFNNRFHTVVVRKYARPVTKVH